MLLALVGPVDFEHAGRRFRDVEVQHVPSLLHPRGNAVVAALTVGPTHPSEEALGEAFVLEILPVSLLVADRAGVLEILAAHPQPILGVEARLAEELADPETIDAVDCQLWALSR